MKRFILASKFVKKNLKNIILFELVYYMFMGALFVPLISGLFKLALNIAGYKYITNTRFISFLLEPSTIAILVLMIILFAYFWLVNINAFVICYDATYHNKENNIWQVFLYGLRSSLSLINNKNIFAPIYAIAMLPLTNIAIVMSYCSTMEIPVDIINILSKYKIVMAVATVLVVFIIIFGLIHLTSINHFSLDDEKFGVAFKKSARLKNSSRVSMIFGYILWELFIFIVLMVTYSILMFVVVNTVKIFTRTDVAYEISLVLARRIFEVWLGLYTCISVPVSVAYISGFFYENKLKNGIEINECKFTNRNKKTRGFKKTKTVISLVVLFSSVLNFLYINLDVGIFGDTKIQLLERVEIAGHRGDSVYAPENTMAAVKGAVKKLADYVEIDVQKTKDGVIILSHDTNLKRTTGLDKEVWETAYDEIQELDAGKWFSDEFEGEPVPMLASILDYAKGKIKLNIEIKNDGHNDDISEKVAALIVGFDMIDDCVVTSFSKKLLKDVKKYNKEIKTGYIQNMAYGDFSDEDYIDALSINYMYATAEMIDAAHNSGKEVYLWTINSAAKIREMSEKGPDMIITDNPGKAKVAITTYETQPWLVKMIKYFNGY